MKLPASLDWKVRAAIDLTVAAAFAVMLWSQGAPTWAITLLVYLATKPSRVSLAGDLAAVQSTVRVELETAIDDGVTAQNAAIVAAFRRSQS